MSAGILTLDEALRQLDPGLPSYPSAFATSNDNINMTIDASSERAQLDSPIITVDNSADAVLENVPLKSIDTGIEDSPAVSDPLIVDTISAETTVSQPEVISTVGLGPKVPVFSQICKPTAAVKHVLSAPTLGVTADSAQPNSSSSTIKRSKSSSNFRDNAPHTSSSSNLYLRTQRIGSAALVPTVYDAAAFSRFNPAAATVALQFNIY